MTLSSERAHNEIAHGQKLAASGNPENIWNWNSPAGRVRAVRRGTLIAQTAQLSPGMRVMEIGCGTGLFTEIFARYGASILAVDISPDLLSYARARYLPQEQVEFREMRFEDCDVESPFDAILGSSVLHHLDMHPALQTIYKLLKPGGIMVFAEPNMLNPQVWAERHIPVIRERNGASPDEMAIVRWSMARDLASVGFTDIRLRNIDWLHPATPEPLIGVVSQLGRLLEQVPLIREFTGSLLISGRRPTR
jgi:2-polyprenyl-3-methyl-5-hydroxy-6-metoxy-1,4-benzoquinol methylase